MTELSIGRVIRKQREALGFTQEQLCGGICEPSTLSRFEKGQCSLSHRRVRTLLQRVGLSDDRFYALLSEDEMALEEAEREARHASVALERAPAEQKGELWKSFRNALHKLESIDPDNPFIRQCSLSLRAVMGTENGPYSFEERLAMQSEAIRLTVPWFDLECVGLGPYSAGELRLIMQIAGTYTNEARYGEAERIYRALLEYLEANGHRLPQYSILRAWTTYNYSRALYRMKRWQEAISMTEAGWQSCVESGNYQTLAHLLWVRGECCLRLGKTSESIDLYRQVHYVLKATGDKYNLPILDAEAKELLNLTFLD